jgi:hypothetical protein
VTCDRRSPWALLAQNNTQLDRCFQLNREIPRTNTHITTRHVISKILQPPTDMPAIDVMASTPAAAQKETTKSVGVLEELIKTLSVSKGQDEANAAAGNLATLLNGPIEERTIPAK